ncbi:MAG: uracil-DNA glycosylase [Anaerolineales bacterium]
MSAPDTIEDMKLDELNAEIITCRKCPRLVAWREEVARVKRKAYRDQEYWGKPVPGFGDPNARVLVVGLAPGAHGSNRTGRQFTGDASGGFLYPALYRAGFANQAEAESRDDGLRLKDMYITASARCAPPDNKPSLEELNNCQPYLARELKSSNRTHRLPWAHCIRKNSQDGFDLKSHWKFFHGAVYQLPASSLSLILHP